VRLAGAGNSMPRVSIHRGQEIDVRAARDELLDQLHVGRIVLDVEHGVPGCALRQLRPDRSLHFAGLDFQLGRRVETSSHQNTLPTRPCSPRRGLLHQFDQSLCHHQADARAGLPAGFLTKPVNGWNSWASFSGVNPAPVSATLIRMRSGALGRNPPPPFPLPLYLIALESRLMMICFNRVRSARTKKE